MEEANAQTKIIERDLNKLSDRFDRHLEIYAQNGKELAALKTSVDGLKTTIERTEMRDKDNLANIWMQTKQNTTDISEINVALGKLMVRVSLISTMSATLASTVASVSLSYLFT